MIKEIIIDALFDAAVKVSKNPDIIQKRDYYAYSHKCDLDKDYFFVIRDTDENNIASSSNVKREIFVNSNMLKDINEITRIFVIMWGGFMYFKNASVFDMFLNNETSTDTETIRYMYKKGLFNIDLETQFMGDLNQIIMEKGISPYNIKRLRNIASVMIDEVKSVKN